MRNLKKILALVLALVMSLSLMATAGAKGFEDSDKVGETYQTAVEVLNGLGVFGGYDLGNGNFEFRPQNNITRAEVATIIYRIVTGDVKGEQAAIYTDMANSKLKDLNQAEWARGFVNYCYNAGIIKGVNDTDFEPNSNITGYAALTMILRAIGYGQNGEFVGNEWEINTASRARELGLLSGITDAQLGQPASRELVAQVLFRTILKETVTWTALNGYQTTGTTLAKSVLGLEEITGVVVANEIADLDDTTPLAEGRTNLVVGEKTYKLNLSTTAEEIGTAIHAYVKGSEVLAREDAGNDIKDNAGAKTSVKDLRDGLRLTDETEYYVNYDPIRKDTSDWRLEYVVVLEDWTEKEVAQLVYDNGGVAFIDDNDENLQLDDAEKTSCIYKTHANNANSATYLKDNGNGVTEKTYTYDKVIPVEEIITAKDHEYIKKIFYGSDSFNTDAEQGDDTMTGEVYVATRSGKNSATDKSYDISDELSYKEFYEKYIDDDLNRSFDAADRGEWLRVIDNDGDGDADYVLRVDFVMTTVVDYDKRTDTYSVEYDADGNHNPNSIETEIKGEDIAKMAEDTDLSDGSVILYALIDGVYHTCNPQVDTAAIEKKTIDIKTETFTANGEEYTWSGIDEEALEYYNRLQDLDEEVSYNLYLDHFGFVRLATEASKGLILLTDGYFGTNYRENEFKATAWTGSALEDIDIEDNGIWKGSDNEWYDGFIDTQEDGDHGNRGTWLRLNAFGEYYYNDQVIAHIGHENDYDTTHKQYHYVDRDDADDTGDDLYVGDPFYTNIAGYVEEDGVYSLYSVKDISTVNGLKRDLNAYEIAGTAEGYAAGNVKKESVKANNRTLYGIKEWLADDAIVDDIDAANLSLARVQTNEDTVYYFVSDASSASKRAVTTWTGYDNYPEELGNFTVTRGYMVSHEIPGTVNYEIADVVVFEGAKEVKSDDAWLVISAINAKRERSLGKDDEGNYGEANTEFNAFSYGQTLAAYPGSDAAVVNGLQQGQIVFFDADGDPIESNFQKYGVYAATVITAPGTRNNNYCELKIDADERYFTKFSTYDVNVFELNQITDEKDHASRNLTTREGGRIDEGDEMIVMLDSKMNVLLAVNVTESGVDGKHDGITKLDNLYDAIVEDQSNQKVWNVTATFTGEDSEDTDTIGLEVTEVSKETGRLELALNTTKYTITDVDVTGDGEAAVIDGKWTLIDVKEDVTIDVTVEKATYTVNIDKTALDASDSAAVSYTGDSGSVTVTSGDKVPVGTELSIAITKNSAATIVYEVTVNDGDPIVAESPNTYKHTVDGETNIVITKTTKSNTAALTALAFGANQGTAPGTVTDGSTQTVNDIPAGTEAVDVTVTTSGDGATVKVWRGAKDANREVTAEENGTYKLAPGAAGAALTYVIEVYSQAGNVKHTLTIKLECAAASTETDLAKTTAGDGKVKVTTTQNSEKVEILDTYRGVATVADLKSWIKISDDSAATISVVDDADADQAADVIITADMEVKVLAEDGEATVNYAIAFAASVA